ncbi:MAG TPA: NUDIX domain-containing protein [archaeon]|nr:NUDIX domain-containing protein [archaeon]
MKRERSCGLVIFRGRKTASAGSGRRGLTREYLLIQHSSLGHWEFPKGWPEAGESDEAAALREAKEEAGLTGLELVPGFAERIHYFYRLEGELVSKDVTFFLAQAPARAEVKISWEHKGFAWLPAEAAKERATKKNTKELIEKAERFLAAKGKATE